MRLIDADKLKETLKDQIIAYVLNIKGMFPTYGESNLFEQIDNAPTIDAEPIKHGRWIKFDYYLGIDVYKCSECGMKIKISPNCDGTERLLGKFCENCGARMDGGENER